MVDVGTGVIVGGLMEFHETTAPGVTGASCSISLDWDSEGKENSTKKNSSRATSFFVGI